MPEGAPSPEEFMAFHGNLRRMCSVRAARDMSRVDTTDSMQAEIAMLSAKASCILVEEMRAPNDRKPWRQLSTALDEWIWREAGMPPHLGSTMPEIMHVLVWRMLIGGVARVRAAALHLFLDGENLAQLTLSDDPSADAHWATDPFMEAMLSVEVMKDLRSNRLRFPNRPSWINDTAKE